MPVVVAGNSTMAEHIRCRKPSRNQAQTQTHSLRIPETDPDCSQNKSTISSLLISSKKKNFTSSTFRGLGCTASSQVSVPAVIRTSANWEAKKVRKKKLRSKKNNSKQQASNNACLVPNNSSNNSPITQTSSVSMGLSSSCVGVPDVWCGPGVRLTTDAASVDCVVTRRPPVSTRGKVDGVEKIVQTQRERPCTLRRMVTQEDMPFFDPDNAMGMPRTRVDISGSRHHRHARHGLPEGLAEIVMLQSSLMMGGRSDGLDRYRDLRLDIDNMSYEELLELGDKIGYVNTGLKEEDITSCLRRTKLTTSGSLSSQFSAEMERKCSICQEEFEADDEMGKLNCGHFYHIHCIKQWLVQKNICPICKSAAASQV